MQKLFDFRCTTCQHIQKDVWAEHGETAMCTVGGCEGTMTILPAFASITFTGMVASASMRVKSEGKTGRTADGTKWQVGKLGKFNPNTGGVE